MNTHIGEPNTADLGAMKHLVRVKPVVRVMVRPARPEAKGGKHFFTSIIIKKERAFKLNYVLKFT